MVKIKASMNEFEFHLCNRNDSGSIVSAPGFSEVTILGRLPYIKMVIKIHFIYYIQKQINM